MPDMIIEAKWEELVQRTDLRGRRLRVTVMDEPSLPGPHANESNDAWLARLRAWAVGHPRVEHVVHDSRESIYDGTVENPR